jgi:hypothetical protein
MKKEGRDRQGEGQAYRHVARKGRSVDVVSSDTDQSREAAGSSGIKLMSTIPLYVQ